jgi:hypothetical protein
VEFTKFTDKRDLMNILTQLENEKILLLSSISEHGLKCQSVLDSCKNKFSQPGCDMTHTIKKKELEETIEVTKKSITENKEILDDIAKLLDNTQKDCAEVETFYHNSKEKLNKDKNIIKKIKIQVHKKLKQIKLEQKQQEQERKRQLAILALTKVNVSNVNSTNTTIKNQSKPLLKKITTTAVNNNGSQNKSHVIIKKIVRVKKIIKRNGSTSKNITSSNQTVKTSTKNLTVQPVKSTSPPSHASSSVKANSSSNGTLNNSIISSMLKFNKIIQTTHL